MFVQGERLKHEQPPPLQKALLLSKLFVMGKLLLGRCPRLVSAYKAAQLGTGGLSLRARRRARRRRTKSSHAQAEMEIVIYSLIAPPPPRLENALHVPQEHCPRQGGVWSYLPSWYLSRKVRVLHGQHPLSGDGVKMCPREVPCRSYLRTVT